MTTEIVQGDSLPVLLALPPSSVDLFVLDPPYALGMDTWDEFDSLDHYADWFIPYLQSCRDALAPDGNIMLFGAPDILFRIAQRILSTGLHLQDSIVWIKSQGGNSGKHLMKRQETILWLTKSSTPFFNKASATVAREQHNVRKYNGRVYDTKRLSNVWQFDQVGGKSRERRDIATQKPVELIQRIVELFSPDNGFVVDPFAGSGTTGEACFTLRRRCLLIEQRAEAVADIRKRCSQLSLFAEQEKKLR